MRTIVSRSAIKGTIPSTKITDEFRRRVACYLVSPCTLEFALAPHDNGKRRRRYARLRVHRALKESQPRVFFCRPPRFNWMSLLRCRALLSVPGTLLIGLPSLFQPRAERSRPLLFSTPFASLTPRIPRSLTRRSSILYLLYRRDQSRRIPRACAARNERSPVSCLSFRPSVQRTGRPVACLPCPLLVPSREVPLCTPLPLPPLRLLPAIFARLVPYSISSLSIHI